VGHGPQVGWMVGLWLDDDYSLCLNFVSIKNCFRLLDLSFNRIRKIENINHLHKLKKLFLVNNKITVIEDISQLTELTMLELGANRIRVSKFLG